MTRSETGEARADDHDHHASIAPEPFPLSSKTRVTLEQIMKRRVSTGLVTDGSEYMAWFKRRGWRQGERMPRRETKVEEAVD